MKKFTKIFVAVLALAIVIGAVAMVAGAADVKDISLDVTEAMGENGSGKVVLTEDSSVALINVLSDLEIDLNGYTLYCDKEYAFNVCQEGVTLNITGEGAIKVDGAIAVSKLMYPVTVNIVGAIYENGVRVPSAPIMIEHTGKSNVSIVSTLMGNWNFENLDIVSTSREKVSFRAFFENNTGASGANFSFNSVKFNATAKNIHTENPGQFFASIAGLGTITIKNSGISTNQSGIWCGNATAVSATDTIISIEDSVFTAVPTYSTKTNYGIYGMFDTTDSKNISQGTVKITNSLFESSGRVFEFGMKCNEKVCIEVVNSIVKNPGQNGSADEELIARGVNMTVDATSCVGATDPVLSDRAVITGAVGTRTNIDPSLPVAILMPDGNSHYEAEGVTKSEAYTWVFDPVGNPDFPYVIAEVGAFNDGDVNYYWGFDNIESHRTKENEIGLLNNDGTNVAYKISSPYYSGTGMHFASKRGSLSEGTGDNNGYLRYWVNPLSTNPTATTRTFAQEASSSGTDPFFVIGTPQYPNAATFATGENRNRVVVVDFDFGTDSEYGYPELSIKSMSRTVNGANAQTGKGLTIHNDGTVENSLSDAKPVNLNPVGMWNHFTAVFYTDPVNAMGIMYLYINGEYVGYTDAYKWATNPENPEDITCIAGVRIDPMKSATHVVNSAFCIDNVVGRGYYEYQAEGERDAQDGETTGVYKPEEYLNITSPKQYMNSPFEIAGVSYEGEINELMAIATANNTCLNIKEDVIVETLITTNGAVMANGNTINYAPDSYGVDVKLKDGELYKYTFNEAYNSFALDYYWYTLGSDLNGVKDINNYIKTTVKVGQIPGYDFINPADADYENGLICSQNGWTTTLGGSAQELSFLSMSYVKNAMEDGGKVFMYPTYAGDTKMTAYIKTAEGPIKAFTNNADTLKGYIGLQDGQTLVLLDDLHITGNDVRWNRFSFEADIEAALGRPRDNNYSEQDLENMKAVAAEIGIDLNGYTVTLTEGGNFVGVDKNVIVNVYSSRPGARVYSRYEKNGKVAGLPLFVIVNGTEEKAEESFNTYNAYINVGTYGDIPGSNLLLEGGVLFEGKEGDNSTGMNVDGVTAIRAFSDSAAAVMTRFFDGAMYFTNTTIIGLTGDNLIDMKGYYGTAYDQGNPSTGRHGKYVNYYFNPYVSFDNCVLINQGTDDGKNHNLVGNNGDDKDYVNLSFKNTITNSRLNPSNYNKRTYIGPGVCTFKMDTAGYTIQSGVTIKQDYYGYITMEGADENGILKVRNPVISGGKVNDENYIYLVNTGVDPTGLVPAGAKVIKLPVITFASRTADDYVKVTYNNLLGEKMKEVTYVKGSRPNLSAINPPALTFNAIKLVPNGVWENYTDVLTEDVVMTPQYDIVSNITGINTSISLYSDLYVNLYVPAAYGDYITSIANGENVLATENVSLDGKDYIKVTVSVDADSLSDDIVFAISVVDGEYNTVLDVKVNMAEYASSILSGSYPEADKKLVYYMVAYAFEADKYFDKRTDKVLEAIVNEYKSVYAPEETVRNYNVLDTAAFAKAFEHVTINVDSSPYYVFKLKAGFVGTVTVTYGDNVKEYNCTAATNYIVVDALEVADFADSFTVSVNGTVNGTDASITSCDYNLDTFIQYHIDNSELNYKSIACMSLVEALYDFAQVAKEYSAQ